ncbi:MAG: ATP synthase F1 subunit delta [Desulfovibrionaceae bacterium]|nr:ATP synthase F1 subunit delta [Desulfovibrionaceae bacterium]
MNSDIVARRYAEALFSLGKERGAETLKRYAENLRGLAELFDAHPELSKIFRTPVFEAQEKQKLLDAAISTESVEPEVKRFYSLLVERSRLALIRQISDCFNTLLDREEGIVRGQLVSAVSLDKERQAGLLATLTKKTGLKLNLRFDVDPDILGGIVLKIGDKVLDASLKAQLNSLRDTIKRGE